MSELLVGVLALQGDVAEHEATCRSIGVATRRVRTPSDLDKVDALILPGGESTTLGMLIDWSGLRAPLCERLGAGMAAFGTCAGMILLADSVVDGRRDQGPLHAIDVVARRNAFGRQLDSFEAELEVSGIEGPPIHAVFIRAPVIEHTGVGVEVLAAVELAGTSYPVVCRAKNVLICSFHPELSGESRLHALFVEQIAGRNPSPELLKHSNGTTRALSE